MPDIAPDIAPGRRPTVLLLAGELRDSWTRPLEQAGFDVRSPGWLDGVTAARLHRPDLVLVSMDLPPNAPQIVTTAFRSSSDLAGIPVAMAGVSEELADELRDLPIRADHYILSPVTPESLAGEVREAIRIGRVPFRRTPAQNAALAIAGVGMLALCSRWEGISHFAPSMGSLPSAVDTALLVGGVVVLLVAIAVGVLTRRRPLTIRQRRSGAAWGAFLLVQLGNLAGPTRPLTAPVGFSLACLAGIEWARLGLRLGPPTPGWRRWYQVLIVLLVALAAAPWVALGILRMG